MNLDPFTLSDKIVKYYVAKMALWPLAAIFTSNYKTHIIFYIL